jgi:Tol biopolymer transport system component
MVMHRISIFIIMMALTFARCGEDEDSNVFNFPGGKATPILSGSWQRQFSSPSWSPDGNTILFVHRFYGWEGQTTSYGYRWESDLWTVSPDGAEDVQLIKTQGRDLTPRWHPNPSVREVVFAILLGTGDDTLYSIYRCNIDGGGLEKVYEINSEICFPSFTHDGNHIIFMAIDEGDGLYKIPVDGGEPEGIENSAGWGRVLSAECSPTEPLVAFYQLKDGAINVYTIPLEGGAPNQLTQFSYGGSEQLLNNPNFKHRLYNLSWFKDGSRLVATHFPEGSFGSWWNSDNVMFFLSKDGGDPLYVEAYMHSPSMSPESNKLVGEVQRIFYIMELTDL